MQLMNSLWYASIIKVYYIVFHDSWIYAYVKMGYFDCT